MNHEAIVLFTIRPLVASIEFSWMPYRIKIPDISFWYALFFLNRFSMHWEVYQAATAQQERHISRIWIIDQNKRLKLLSVKDNSGQMHLSAADHVVQNSSGPQHSDASDSRSS